MEETEPDEKQIGLLVALIITAALVVFILCVGAGFWMIWEAGL